MELRDILSIVRRWWWLLILGTLLPMGISYYVTSSQAPLYQANVTIMVGTTIQSTDPNPGLMNTSTALARFYGELVRRRPVTEAVIERLGLARSPSALAKQITTAVVPDAQLLEIAVIDTDPGLAAELANALAEELVRQSPTSAQDFEGQRAFILSQLDDLQHKIQETDENINDLRDSLSTMTSAAEIQEAQLTLTGLEQVQASYQSTYASLLASLGDTPNALALVEAPIEPSSPIGNRRVLIVALSGMIGLCLSAGAVYLMEYLDDTLRWEGWRQQSIVDLPVLGAVPEIPAGDGPLISRSLPGSPEVDALRALRTNILLARGSESAGSLLLTSCLPNEGKSVVAANLAADFASLGRPVILVDANLRTPTLHQILGLPNEHGLSELLQADDPDIGNALQETNDSNLLFLSSGESPTDPASLLISERARRLVLALRNLYSPNRPLVLFDGPAVLTGPESNILAYMVDETILVVNSALVGRDMLRQVKMRLEEHGQAVLLGIVFNGVKLDSRLRTRYRVSTGLTQDAVWAGVQGEPGQSGQS